MLVEETGIKGATGSLFYTRDSSDPWLCLRTLCFSLLGCFQVEHSSLLSCVTPGSATSSLFNPKILGALVEMKYRLQGPVAVAVWILVVARDKIRNLVFLGAVMF